MFLAAGMAAAVRGQGALKVEDTAEEKVRVSRGGTTLLEYRYSAARPKTYVHPLCLADGTPVTLDGPEDHVHHRGLMVAWSEVNGIDFWGELNPARHGAIVHRGFDRLGEGPPAEIVERNEWVAEGQVLLRERRTVRAEVWGAGALVDWASELEAMVPVNLAAGTHVYNGLGMRVVRAMDMGEVLNARGTRTVEQANGEAAAWCAYTGAGIGVAMFDHPSNARHPNPFFVMREPFGYMSAAPTFRAPFEMARGGRLKFRWGVVTFRGAADAAALGREFEEWSKR
jgi:hypothetical protein